MQPAEHVHMHWTFHDVPQKPTTIPESFMLSHPFLYFYPRTQAEQYEDSYVQAYIAKKLRKVGRACGLPILEPNLDNSHVEPCVLGQLFSYMSGRFWTCIVGAFQSF